MTDNDDKIFHEALVPERRYEGIILAEPRHGYPGDLALFFTNSNGTNIVNLRPGDMPALRAAVLPEDPGLQALREEAAAQIGWANLTFVDRAHAAGYRLGVNDLAATAAMSEAGRAGDWLAARQDTDLPDEVLEAISVVREFISRLAAAEAGRG
jgi:hypothetical protein